MSAASAEVEAQWSYFPRSPDGATAVFMDWTYSAVVLRIHCDRSAGELVFVAPEAAKFGASAQMALILDGDEHPIRTKEKGPTGPISNPTTTADNAMIGRLKLTRELSASIARASNIDVWAPNEVDEPWHVGRAKPLRRLTRACPIR
jgi:hypothetical protein